MPFYRYTAQDTTGRTISGALEATTPDAAEQRLQGMGLWRVRVEGANGSAPSVAVPQASAPRPVAPRPAIPAPVASPVVSRPAVRPATPEASLPRTDPGDDFTQIAPIASARERSFFFDQLGRFIHSGVAPNRALETLGNQKGGRMGEFLRNAARGTSAGLGLGESLRGGYITEPERAALTAAERGGYLPEAAARLADLAMDAHAISRGYWYPTFVLAFALFAGPCTFATQTAALGSIERQDKAGGSLPPVGTLVEEMRRVMPLALLQGALILLVAYGVWRLWNLPANRVLRHRIALGLWPLGPRSRSEGAAQLASHLAALTAAAIPSHEAARLAAATIPNLALRDETQRALGNVAVGTPISGAIARTSLVSEQYRHLVENGELTGDVPGALSQFARVEEGEFKNRSNFARRGLAVMLLLVAAVVIVVLLGHAETAWYSRFIDAMLKTD